LMQIVNNIIMITFGGSKIMSIYYITILTIKEESVLLNLTLISTNSKNNMNNFGGS
jgi:hypothetical protein